MVKGPHGGGGERTPTGFRPQCETELSGELDHHCLFFFFFLSSPSFLNECSFLEAWLLLLPLCWCSPAGGLRDPLPPHPATFALICRFRTEALGTVDSRLLFLISKYFWLQRLLKGIEACTKLDLNPCSTTASAVELGKLVSPSLHLVKIRVLNLQCGCKD